MTEDIYLSDGTVIEIAYHDGGYEAPSIDGPGCDEPPEIYSVRIGGHEIPSEILDMGAVYELLMSKLKASWEP